MIISEIICVVIYHSLCCFFLWHNFSSLIAAWDSFAKSLDTLSDIETVRYDAADVTRQMLQTIHMVIYADLIQVSQLSLFITVFNSY